MEGDGATNDGQNKLTIMALTSCRVNEMVSHTINAYETDGKQWQNNKRLSAITIKLSGFKHTNNCQQNKHDYWQWHNTMSDKWRDIQTEVHLYGKIVIVITTSYIYYFYKISHFAVFTSHNLQFFSAVFISCQKKYYLILLWCRNNII